MPGWGVVRGARLVMLVANLAKLLKDLLKLATPSQKKFTLSSRLNY